MLTCNIVGGAWYLSSVKIWCFCVTWFVVSTACLAQLPFDYFWPIFSVGSSKPPIPKLAKCAGKRQQIWSISNFALGVLLGFLLNRSPASDPTVDSTGIQCLVAPFFGTRLRSLWHPLRKEDWGVFSGAWSGLAPLTRHPSDPVKMIAMADRLFWPCFFP